MMLILCHKIIENDISESQEAQTVHIAERTHHYIKVRLKIVLSQIFLSYNCITTLKVEKPATPINGNDIKRPVDRTTSLILRLRRNNSRTPLNFF